MRILKLQMQITLDGFVGDKTGEISWGDFSNPVSDVMKRSKELVDTSDTILMGRKMAKDFVEYWQGIQPDKPDYAFARKMVDTPKIVFSKTIDKIDGENVTVENGNLATEVKSLKSKPGKDILVYGGAGFVSALIKEHLINEFHLFVHPVLINKGMEIFRSLASTQQLSLHNTHLYENGIIELHYNLK
jgi:dihydrofolate reductase